MEANSEVELSASTTNYQLDSELTRSITNFMNSHPPLEKAAKGDWNTLRKIGNALYTNMSALFPPNPQVKREDFKLQAADGNTILLRWYALEDSPRDSAAVVFVHGGGRVFGSVELYDRVVADYVERSKVPFLSVDYGLAPETYGKAQAEQVLDAILWLKQHSKEMGVDVNRIAIMGDSGGGGIAAGAAILARDRKIQLAKQILLYPMLDYRTAVLDPHLEPFSAFGYQEMDTLWQAAIGPEKLSEYDLMITSPALLDNFAGLAPAYISIGDVDYFRNENLDYARKLTGAAVPLEFHLYANTPHGFEIFTPGTELAERGMSNHTKAIQSF
jgi:acetyl esterase/lipase